MKKLNRKDNKKQQKEMNIYGYEEGGGSGHNGKIKSYNVYYNFTHVVTHYYCGATSGTKNCYSHF